MLIISIRVDIPRGNAPAEAIVGSFINIIIERQKAPRLKSPRAKIIMAFFLWFDFFIVITAYGFTLSMPISSGDIFAPPAS
jgi:hypothetical protein